MLRNFDLTILPAQDNLVQRRPMRRQVHPNLPDIYKGAVVLLIGKVKAGKTTTILNWIQTSTRTPSTKSTSCRRQSTKTKR